jgi:ribosome-binding protein aMBF1 (putative translation factor)
MKKEKCARLEAKGWRVGNAADFLGLSQEEAALIELKADLGAELRQHRQASRMTQFALAKKLRSSQSRIAKMESGDPSVSLDLLMRSLFAMGIKRTQIAKTMSRKSKAAV